MPYSTLGSSIGAMLIRGQQYQIKDKGDNVIIAEYAGSTIHSGAKYRRFEVKALGNYVNSPYQVGALISISEFELAAEMSIRGVEEDIYTLV